MSVNFNLDHPSVRISDTSDPVFTVLELEGLPLKVFVRSEDLRFDDFNGMAVNDLAQCMPMVAFPFRISYQSMTYSNVLKGLFTQYVYLRQSDALADAAKPDTPEETQL